MSNESRIAPRIVDFDSIDFYEDDNSCPNCGGEGIVYSCFEEFACIDPEGGCDLCERRCDWCCPASSNRGEEGKDE